MNKILTSILTAVFISMMTVPVCANSAPSYWEAYPYSEVLSIDESSPITVSKESLSFDFSKHGKEKFPFSPTAQVTAKYEMSNPTSEPLSVQMAFPLVSSLSELTIPKIEIKADNVRVPFEIFPSMDEADWTGDSEEGFRYDGFDISREEIEFPELNMEREGTLYICRMKTDEEENYSLEACFNADPKKTRLIGKNFNSASYTEGEGSCLGARFHRNNDREMEILVLGADCGLTFKVLTEGGEEADAKRYNLEISSETVNPKTYLLNEAHENFGDAVKAIDDTQLLNIYCRKIWQDGLVTGYATLEDVLSSNHMDRIITLIYKVDFPAHSTRIVSVGYQTDGTMDRRETITPKYSYTYLLSPAKNWADFGELEIKIVTPDEAPYIIGSSIDFGNDGQNQYSARLDGLPDGELDFTIYKNPEVTFLDKTRRTAENLSYSMFFLWPFIIIALVVIAAVIIRSIRMKNENKKN